MDTKNSNGLVTKRGTLGALVDFQLVFEAGLTAMKIRNTHLEKNGTPDPETEKLVKETLKFKKKFILDPVAKILRSHPAYPWFSKVKGIGNENIAKVVTLIDIEKAPTISALWKYAGYAVVEGNAERRKKGEKLHFNMELKVMCHRVGTALLKAHAISKDGTRFGHFFEKAFEQEKQKFESKGMTVIPTTEWKKLVNSKKKAEEEKNKAVSEFYVHNRAFRRTIKLFLGCLWIAWREAENLPTRDPFAVEKMAHTSIIRPEEMTDR